jgi:hypothetical protein
MDVEVMIVWGLMAFGLYFLLLAFVIRAALDRSKLTEQLAALTDEVRMLRRELAKEQPNVIDKRV